MWTLGHGINFIEESTDNKMLDTYIWVWELLCSQEMHLGYEYLVKP